MEKLLSINDLAELLGAGRSTIYFWQANGTPLPPSVRIGKRQKWRQSDVENWLNNQRQAA